MVEQADLSRLRVALKASHASAVAKLVNAKSEQKKLEQARQNCLMETIPKAQLENAPAQSAWIEWNRRKMRHLSAQIEQQRVKIDALKSSAQICHARLEAANSLAEDLMAENNRRTQLAADNSPYLKKKNIF